MSTARRKEEIKKVRAEGATAARDGKHSQTCPYSPRSMNYYQWMRGYREEDVPVCAQCGQPYVDEALPCKFNGYCSEYCEAAAKDDLDED